MKLVRVVVVEDEPLARQKLRGLLDEIEWLEQVGEADTGARAVEAIDTLHPDLVFLDIQLPELDGLEVLRRIAHQPAVIFTTAYDRYAVSAFELEALDYLLKPFGADRLQVALDRARRALGDPDAPPVRDRAARALEAPRDGLLTTFFVRDQGKLMPVHTRDIERLEADDDYVRVHTRGQVYLVYLTLNDFERRLDPHRFVRIHRAHVVNLDFVSHLVPYDGSRMQVEMRDKTKILASRARSRELRELTL
jgi:two-component system, LytTR family, response regulator